MKKQQYQKVKRMDNTCWSHFLTVSNFSGRLAWRANTATVKLDCQQKKKKKKNKKKKTNL